MPSIDDLNKKREKIEAKRREIADKAAERAAKEYDARLEAEAKSLDWELEQLTAMDKAQEQARKESASTRPVGVPSDDEVKRLMEAARAKAAGGTPPKPKTTESGSGAGNGSTASKKEN